MLVAVLIVLGMASHGNGRLAGEHPLTSGEIMLSVSFAHAHETPADAVCGQSHCEHHQVAPMIADRKAVERDGLRVAYWQFDRHPSTREISPPHGPPRA